MGGGGGRGTGSGGMRAALRKDKGRDKASGDRSTAMGHPEKREMDVTIIKGRVRSTMEYPLWVSRVLLIVGRKGAPSRQPGQRTRWGGYR